MVAHQHHLGTAAHFARADQTHTVMGGRRQQPVTHHVAGPAVRLVAKACRQLDQGQSSDQIVDRCDRAIGAGGQQRRRRWRTGRCLCSAAGQRSNRAGEGRKQGCRTAFQNRASWGGNFRWVHTVAGSVGSKGITGSTSGQTCAQSLSAVYRLLRANVTGV